MGIKVINGGLLTTVQDGGRPGYQRFGMVVSGCMDLHSYRLANLLVGNEEGEAVLEATLLGPALELTSDCLVAVTGGDLSPTLNGQPLPMYQAVQCIKGDRISFGAPKSGCRAYLAFSGGLDVPLVMGSRSTYLKAGIGGLEGRKLAAGDEIGFRKKVPGLPNLERRRMEPTKFIGDYTLRVLMGPQEDLYTEEGLQTFLSATYQVTDKSDRMGCRLSGPAIQAVGDGNIITDGIAFGAIQVPQQGEPIIMMADRQTTGGYGKIAHVISADLPLMAQCKAGDKVRFVKTDVDTAQQAYLARVEEYRRLQESFEWAHGKEKTLFVTVNGQKYRVEVEVFTD